MRINLKLWFFTILMLSISIIVFNFIINPFGIFEHETKFNTIKNNLLSDKMTKFYYAKRSEATVLIIGTSRSAHMNPEVLENVLNKKVYNLSLGGSTIYEHYHNIKYFVENKNIDIVILSTDFFSYNPLANKIGSNALKGFDIKRFDKYSLDDYINSLFSLKGTAKSLLTLKDSILGKTMEKDLSIGWDIRNNSYFKIKKYGNKEIIKGIKNSLKSYSGNKEVFGLKQLSNFDSVNKTLNYIEKIVKICNENDVVLKVYISPVYSKHIDLIYSLDLGSTYEYWKKSLVETIGNIYDFSSYNSITNNLNWFLDSSHIQVKASDYIFYKLVYDKSFDNNHSDFGILLNKSNISNYLIEQRTKVEEYDISKFENLGVKIE